MTRQLLPPTGANVRKVNGFGFIRCLSASVFFAMLAMYSPSWRCWHSIHVAFAVAATQGEEQGEEE
jgi:hypothetical protein